MVRSKDFLSSERISAGASHSNGIPHHSGAEVATERRIERKYMLAPREMCRGGRSNPPQRIQQCQLLQRSQEIQNILFRRCGKQIEQTDYAVGFRAGTGVGLNRLQ